MIKPILHSVVAFFAGIGATVRKFFIHLGLLKGSTLVIASIAVFWFGFSYFFGGSAGTIAPQDTTKTVSVASVAELSQGGSSLSVAGVVQSLTEATVRAEKSGKVVAVYRAMGDFVSAGTIVAELENASERAAVLQAQGALQAATAGANVSQSTLASTKDSSVAALLAAYGAVEKAVHGDIDAMFSNPHSTQPLFNVQSSDTQAKLNVQNTRIALTTILNRESGRTTTLIASDDLPAEMIKTEGELKVVRDYLDTVIRTLNAGIATEGISETTLATYKTTATAARSTITTALSTLITARVTLETALKTSAQGVDTVSATQAAITSAQGTLAAARANLEKSIIRAPISGTINSLALERGDFIQATAPALTVANNSALEVISYITANDMPRIAVGDKATLEGSIKGVITRIAPAIDPITKKIEVRIGLSSGASTLVNGQSVAVNFEKAAATSAKPSKGPITIPIAALKIGSENISVFTVDADNKLVAHEVTLGTLLGDRVEIKSGITPEMQIVIDARGLQPGEKVLLKN